MISPRPQRGKRNSIPARGTSRCHPDGTGSGLSAGPLGFNSRQRYCGQEEHWSCSTHSGSSIGRRRLLTSFMGSSPISGASFSCTVAGEIGGRTQAASATASRSGRASPAVARDQVGLVGAGSPPPSKWIADRHASSGGISWQRGGSPQRIARAGSRWDTSAVISGCPSTLASWRTCGPLATRRLVVRLVGRECGLPLHQ